MPLPITTHCVVRRIGRGRIVEWRVYLDSAPGDESAGGRPARLAGIHRLISEQAALRRVATLVARSAAQSEVFDAVVAEAAELFGEEAWLVRFGVGDTATVLAQRGARAVRELTGHKVTGDGVLVRVRRSARPSRVESDGDPGAPAPELARQLGVVAGAGVPLIVEGAPWGALKLVSRGPSLAAGIEDRLAQFADLAANAVANAQSRAGLQSLADEQAALLRVADLRGASTQEVFARVTNEASRLLDDTPATLLRYERAGTEAAVVAQSRPRELGRSDSRFTVGARVPVTGEIGRARVWRTGRAARIDDYEGVAGAEVLPAGVGASVSVPIVVERRLCAARAGARHPARGAGPWRTVRRGRIAAEPRLAPRGRGGACRAAARARRDQRLFRHRRGADQRHQARWRRPGAGSGARHRRPARGRGLRRWPGRRGPDRGVGADRAR